jgi:hypothetical protein
MFSDLSGPIAAHATRAQQLKNGVLMLYVPGCCWQEKLMEGARRELL